MAEHRRMNSLGGREFLALKVFIHTVASGRSVLLQELYQRQALRLLYTVYPRLHVFDLFYLSLSDTTPEEIPRGKSRISSTSSSQAPFLRWVLTLSFLMATVAVGIYAM